jgi:hypothetical protein
MTAKKHLIFYFLGTLLWAGAGFAQEDYSPTATADFALAYEGYPRLAFDPSSARLAAALRKGPGEDGRVVFFSVPDLTVIREVVMDAEPRAVVYNKQGDLFGVAVSEDPNLKFALLSTADWRTTYSNNDIQDVISTMAFDPLGELLFVGERNKGGLVRFEIGPWTRQEVPAMDGQSGGCRSLAFSADGQHAAAGTVDSVVYVWPMDTASPATRLGINRFRGAITAVAFSRDSKFLAAGDDSGQVMIFYRTEDNRWAWKGLFSLPAGGITAVAFLQDNSLVTADSLGIVARWNIENPQSPVETMSLGAGNAEVLALDPQANWMAVGGNKIFLFPVGSAEATREVPSAPVTVVDRTPVEDLSDFVPEVPSVSMAPPSATDRGSETIEPAMTVPEPLPGDEDLKNFVIWMGPDKEAGDGEDWIQGWAAYLDSGLFSPIQLVLPYADQTTTTVRTNLTNLGNVLNKDDFLAFYASGVLCATKEPNDYRIAFGPFLNEQVKLSAIIRALETANLRGPVIWFLDLVPAPDLSEEQTSELIRQVTQFTATAMETVEPGEPAPVRRIGTGLITLSKEGCYEDLSGSLREALSGRADTNGDGRLHDRELMLYLSKQCRSASRATAIGDPNVEIPALPAFRLNTR